MAAKLLWNSTNLAILTLAVGAATVLFTIWLYPPQTRTIRKRWQWLLPAMRVTALLLLAVSLLKPTLLRPRTADEQGAVLLLVDRSASMGVVDRERPIGEQVALADSLGLLPQGARTLLGERPLELAAALRPQIDEVVRLLADVEYARLSGSGEQRAANRLGEAIGKSLGMAEQLQSTSRAVPLDDALNSDLAELARRPDERGRWAWARKAQRTLTRLEKRLGELQREADRACHERDAAVREACAGLNSASRLDLVEKALTAPGSGLLDQLPADVPLFGFAFGQGITPLPLRGNGQSVRRLGLIAGAPASDPAGAIASAIDAIKGRPLQAVVVLTDGRQTGAAEASAAQLGLRGTPVFPVAAAMENSLRDLSIESLAAPAGPFVGQTTTVRVAVRSLKLTAKNLEVTLRFGSTQQSRRIDLAADTTATAEFDVKLDQPGVQELTASIPELRGEATTSNNTARRLIKVHADKVRVLALSGYANWDYQYIRNAVSRAAWATLTERLIAPGQTLDLSPGQLSQADVILLFNVPARSMRPEQIDEIHQAVTRRAVSVLLAAEDPAALDEYGASPLLEEFLPYRQGQRVAWRVWPGMEPAFRIAPAKAVESDPLLRLADDSELSRQRWASLPAVYRYMVLPELKANVLRPLLAERDSSLPVLTESRLGLGRVFFLGLDESWRWRRNVGERDQDRLWLQLIRYAADEPYASTAGRLALDIDRVRASAGQPVKARVRVDRTGLPETASLLPQLRVLQDGREIRQERLMPASPYAPGRFEAQIRDLPEGQYEVEASAPAAAEATPPLKLPLTVGPDPMAEMANLAPDLQRLEQIARATGGAVLNLDQLKDLPRRLSGLQDKTPATVEIALWDSGAFFLLVLALFGAEWAIRKRLGLP